MRGYGNCAPLCLGWQSSAPVQGSPSHPWMEWAGGLPVACGVLRLSLLLPAGFGAVPSWALYTKGRRRARDHSVAARDPALVGSELGCGLVPSRWDAGWYWWHQWHSSWVSHALVFG